MRSGQSRRTSHYNDLRCRAGALLDNRPLYIILVTIGVSPFRAVGTSLTPVIFQVTNSTVQTDALHCFLHFQKLYIRITP
jgi:hypothetical protein